MSPRHRAFCRSYLVAALLGLALLLHCGPSPTARLVTVAIEPSCPSPQAGWFREAVEGLAVPEGRWRLVAAADAGADGGVGPDLRIRCVEFPPGETALARYRLGSGVIEVDVARVPTLQSALGALRHDLIHDLLFRGPRPGYATMHVCAVGEADGSCWPGYTWPSALMAPNQRTATPDGGEGIGPIAVSDPTIADLDFVAAGMRPLP